MHLAETSLQDRTQGTIEEFHLPKRLDPMPLDSSNQKKNRNINPKEEINLGDKCNNSHLIKITVLLIITMVVVEVVTQIIETEEDKQMGIIREEITESNSNKALSNLREVQTMIIMKMKFQNKLFLL